LAPTAAPGTNNTQIATTAYTDAAVAALVDGAPDLLNTLNELAAAIDDDANFASTLTTLAGEKVAKSGDTMTGLLVLSADPSADLGAATKQYVDAAQDAAEDYADGLASNYDAAGSAATAQSNAEDYADGLAVNYDAAGAAAAAETNANSYTDTEIGLLDTDDIEEGSNQYFTDARAKGSAIDLLTSATLTNITITALPTPNTGLVITAENGVADSDTDDLTEGTTNLYFTNTRAVDALEAVVPNFTAVEVNSLAKQIAATVSAPTGGSQVIPAGQDDAGQEYRSVFNSTTGKFENQIITGPNAGKVVAVNVICSPAATVASPEITGLSIVTVFVAVTEQPFMLYV
jgi:hypothetical protein